MTATPILPADLLAQLGDLINATQTVSADAEKWRMLRRLLRELGYGPSIDPATIASLLPHPQVIAGIVASSQEAPPPAAPKSGTGKRRSITDEDKLRIRQLYIDGVTVRDIMDRYGYSKSTVERYARNGDAA